MAFDTELAVRQEIGRKVAIKGTGESVKMIFAPGLAARIRSRMRTRLAWFSSQEEMRNPCRLGSNTWLGMARQKGLARLLVVPDLGQAERDDEHLGGADDFLGLGLDARVDQGDFLVLAEP